MSLITVISPTKNRYTTLQNQCPHFAQHREAENSLFLPSCCSLAQLDIGKPPPFLIEQFNKLSRHSDMKGDENHTPLGIVSYSDFTKSPEMINVKKGKPKKKKHEYTLAQYVELINKLDRHQRHIIYTDSLVRDVEEYGDKQLKLHFYHSLYNSIQFMVSEESETNKFFPKSPRIFLNAKGQKIPHQLAKAQFVYFKYIFETSDKAFAEDVLKSAMSSASYQIYGNAYNFMISLGKKLNANGFKVDMNIKLKK